MKNITLFFICTLLIFGCATTNDMLIFDQEVRRQNLELSKAVKEIESLKKEMDILYQKMDITPVINQQATIKSTLDQQAMLLVKHSLEFQQIHSTINNLREDTLPRIRRIEDAHTKSPSTPPPSPRTSSTSTSKSAQDSTTKSSSTVPSKPLPAPISQSDVISTEEASKFIGKIKTVCGEVVSCNYAAQSRGKPTFLNLDKPYPTQLFTIVIWGSDRNKFKDPPEVVYKGKKICVKGMIETFRGKPQIIVNDPSQLFIKSNLSSSSSSSNLPSYNPNLKTPILTSPATRYHGRSQRIRVGDEVEFYDYEKGEYKYGEVESISGDEIEVYDYEEDEYHYVDKDDIE